MNTVKPPTTFQQQVERIKEKGFVVQNEQFLLEFLSFCNYYKFSAYFLPYKTETNKYQKNIQIEHICNTYLFDCDLRKILYHLIQYIELDIKTKISYWFSHKYGTLGYLDQNNFSAKHNVQKFNENIAEIFAKHEKSLVVQHHVKKYNAKMPFWVIIDFFTMSQLSFFFADMYQNDKEEFLKHSYSHKILFYEYESWLKCISILRNMTAHFARIYFHKFSAIPNFNKTRNLQPTRRLIDTLHAIKLLFPKNVSWNTLCIKELETCINKYSNSLNLDFIGFPQNWKEVLEVEE